MHACVMVTHGLLMTQVFKTAEEVGDIRSKKEKEDNPMRMHSITFFGATGNPVVAGGAVVSCLSSPPLPPTPLAVFLCCWCVCKPAIYPLSVASYHREGLVFTSMNY